MNSTRRRIRYGIIGFGNFAERAIAPAIKASANSELVAIQKRSLAHAKEKAQEHNIPLAFNTAEALVANPLVDAVFIVSVNSLHCSETATAAEAGKHVLVEKPMAMNVAEAEHMIAVCTQHGVKLMVAHMSRFSPPLQRLQHVLASGDLGDVIAARAEFMFDSRKSPRTWFTDRGLAGGGPIFDIGVHCLDALRQVVQDDVVAVRSVLDPFATATVTETTAELAMQFSRGTVGSIFVSFNAPMLRKTLEVIGTKGIARVQDFTAGNQVVPLTIERIDSGGKTKATVEKFSVPNLYVEEITHFSDCIINDAVPVSSGENGLANQRVLDAGIRGRSE